MDKPPATDRFVGIDVSKDRVDVHVRPDVTVFACTTDPGGLADLVNRLAPLQPHLVAMEASGGYEAVVAAALAEAGLPVAIVNPRQVRKFAGAIGRLAKTDAIDAGVIAHFADAIRPAPKPMPDARSSASPRPPTNSPSARSRPSCAALRPSGRGSTAPSTR